MSPRLTWPPILRTAADIVNSYSTGVTLRQLFYRLVAAGVLPNTRSAYSHLSEHTAAARREGAFPELVDRTRAIRRPASWTSPADAIDDALLHYRRDRTAGQGSAIYVGVEKAGLVNQLWSWFSDLGVPILALGGYSSQTFVDDVAYDASRDGRKAVLLYGGDFDPSGEDIDRDFVERCGCFDEVVRVALTADQVAEYGLPPAMGKATDSRSGSFVARHGELVQVELDALPPDVLQQLYTDAIDEYWDTSAYDAVVARERGERERLREFAEGLDDEDADEDDDDGDTSP